MLLLPLLLPPPLDGWVAPDVGAGVTGAGAGVCAAGVPEEAGAAGALEEDPLAAAPPDAAADADADGLLVVAWGVAGAVIV